jgi:hypothetical protein
MKEIVAHTKCIRNFVTETTIMYSTDSQSFLIQGQVKEQKKERKKENTVLRKKRRIIFSLVIWIINT